MSEPTEPKPPQGGASGASPIVPKPKPAGIVDPEVLSTAENDLFEEIEFAASALGPASEAPPPAPDPDFELPLLHEVEDPSGVVDWGIPEEPDVSGPVAPLAAVTSPDVPSPTPEPALTPVPELGPSARSALARATLINSGDSGEYEDAMTGVGGTSQYADIVASFSPTSTAPALPIVPLPVVPPAEEPPAPLATLPVLPALPTPEDEPLDDFNLEGLLPPSTTPEFTPAPPPPTFADEPEEAAPVRDDEDEFDLSAVSQALGAPEPAPAPAIPNTPALDFADAIDDDDPLAMLQSLAYAGDSRAKRGAMPTLFLKPTSGAIEMLGEGGTEVLSLDDLVEVEPVTPKAKATPPPPPPPSIPPPPPPPIKREPPKEEPKIPFAGLTTAPLPALGAEPWQRWIWLYSTEAQARPEVQALMVREAGRVYEDAGALEEALLCYQSALTLAPGDEVAAGAVVRLQAKRGAYEALDAFLAQPGPNGASGWASLERALRREAVDPVTAASLYEEARSAEKEVSALALVRLAQGFSARDERAALAEAIEAIEAPAWRAGLLAAAAHAAEQAGDLSSAVDALRAARHTLPGAPLLDSELARLFVWQGRTAELIELLREGAERASGSEAAAQLRLAAALALYQRNDTAEAWSLVGQALANDPLDAALREFAALIASRAGLADERNQLRAPSDTHRGEEATARLLDAARVALATRGESEALREKLAEPSDTVSAYALERIRLGLRLARVEGDISSERLLLAERRGLVSPGSRRASYAEMTLAQLSQDPLEERSHLSAALGEESCAPDAGLALAELSRGEDANAELSGFRAALSASSDTTKRFFGLHLSASAARYGDTEARALALAALAGDAPGALRELALAYEKAGRTEEAEQTYATIAKHPGASREERRLALLEHGRLAELRGELAAAAEGYLQLLQEDPTDQEALLGVERSKPTPARLAAAYEHASPAEDGAPWLHRAASLYLSAGEKESAARLYERLLAANPTDTLALLGLVAARRGDTARLREALQHAAQPEDELGALAALELAALREGAGDDEGAADAYRRVQAAGTALSLPALQALVELEMRRGRWDQVEALADSLHLLAPARRQAVYRGLAATLERKDLPRAFALYQQLTAEDPGDPTAWLGLWRVADRLGERDAAARAAAAICSTPLPAAALSLRLRAVELLPAEGAAEQVAFVLSATRADPAALFAAESRRGAGIARGDLRVAYEARLASAPQHERNAYMLRLAEQEAETNRAAQGLALLGVAREKAPENIPLLLGQRRVARAAGNTAAFLQATESLAALLKNKRSAGRLLREAGQEALRGGDTAAAESLLRRALAHAPKDHESLLALVPLLAGRGANEELVELLRAHEEAREESAALLTRYGVALLQLGRAGDARRALLRSLAKNPGDREALGSLFALSREQQRTEEAVELARRLRKRADGPEEVLAAELRLAEALAASSQKADAIPHFLQYLRQRPDDTDITQRFLSFAIEIGQAREAVQLLDARYQAAPDDAQRRQIAERLGRLLDQEAGQPAAAAEWYAKALGHDPLGAECGARLVSLWKGKEDRRLLALLEGVFLRLTAQVRESPWRWDVYRRLAALFGWLEDRIRYHVIYDLAQAVNLSGDLPPPVLAPPRPATRPLSEADARALIPQSRQTRELLVALREILPKAFPRSTAEYNLGRRDRLREGTGAERRRELDGLAARFGLSLAEAYVGGDPNGVVVMQSGAELLVVLGSAKIQAPLTPESLFAVGRGFTAARAGLLPLLDAGPAVIEGVFRGMAWSADDRQRGQELSVAAQRAARSIYENMTRGLRRTLGEQFTAIAQRFPEDLDELARELGEEADRGGLLAAGSLRGALRGVAEPLAGGDGAPYRSGFAGAETAGTRGEDALRSLLSRPRALALLQFALSKEYEGILAALSA